MLSDTDSRTSRPLNQAQTPCVSSRAGCAADELAAGTWAVVATTAPRSSVPRSASNVAGENLHHELNQSFRPVERRRDEPADPALPGRAPSEEPGEHEQDAARA